MPAQNRCGSKVLMTNFTATYLLRMPMPLELIEVTSKALAKDFLLMPLAMYSDDPNYIRPLDKDIENVFDPKKNKAFRFGTCARWLLKNSEGEYVGRIAAFVNKRYKNKGDEQKTGGIGFFECINNQEAADMLFDVSKNWLMQRGMEAMDGPINFGERNRWWGLVVQGFQPPMYTMNYNPSYYQKLFEEYGFKPFYHQLCFAMEVHAQLEDRFREMNEKYEKLPGYEARIIDKKNLRKFSRDFVEVYNQAWAGHDGNKEMKEEIAYRMFRSMKPIIDQNIVWFVFHKERPIAFFINIPELNPVFKEFNGKFGLLQKVQFFLSPKRKRLKKFTGIVFGVIPEYQGSGIDYFMIAQAAKHIRAHTQYRDYEMQWMGDFNPKMVNISKHLGAHLTRKLTTYRYLFDRTREFKRHPIL